MTRPIGLMATLCLFAAAMLAPRPAARAAELEDALPESTVVLVKVSDWAKTRKDIDGTALGKILAEEDVKEYLKGVGVAFEKVVAALEKKSGVKSADLGAAYGSELALVVLGPEKPTADQDAGRQIRENEGKAVGSCLAYAAAQTMFHRNDWDGNGVMEYATPFSELSSTKDADGNPIQLIDKAFAAAVDKEHPKHGYIFRDIKDFDNKVAVDFVNEFALCATPAEYGKTGRRTFVISTNGTVFAKDLGKAAFVEAYPADPQMGGWQLAEEMGGGREIPPFVVAIVARLGDPAAAGRIDAVIEMALKSAPRTERKPVAWGEIKGLSVCETGKAAEGAFYSVRAGAYQLWAFGPAEAKVRELAVALAAGKCEKSLAAAEDFKLCRGKLGERADLLWYLGLRKGLDQIMAFVPERDRAEAEKVLGALKVRDISAAAGAVSVDPPGFRSRSFLACKESDDGVVGLLGGEALPPELLKLAPANATGMMAGSFRFDRVLPLVRKVADAAREGGAAEMDQNLAGVKGMLGIDIEKDLLGALTGRGVVFAMPAQAVGGNPLLGQINGLVIAAEVKDAVALRGAADKLVELAKASMAGRGGLEGEGAGAAKDVVSVFEYRGQKVTCFNLMMVAPGFAITDKYLFIGGSVQAVKKAIAQAAGGGEALVDSELYKKAMAAVETKDAASVSYMNTSDSVATAVASAGMFAGLMLPAISQVRGRAQQVSSASNLRQIGLACALFADENDEAYPASLKELQPDYVDNARIYQCPTYARHAADGVDYAYVAGLRSIDGGDSILAFEPIAGADGKVNAVYVDGHVARSTLEEIRKALAAQAAKLKEAKREMKVIEPQGVEAGGAQAEELDPELFVELLKAAVNPAALPAPESFTKHLFPAVGVTRRVEGGILSESFSPLGFSGAPGLGGGGGDRKSVV